MKRSCSCWAAQSYRARSYLLPIQLISKKQPKHFKGTVNWPDPLHLNIFEQLTAQLTAPKLPCRFDPQRPSDHLRGLFRGPPRLPPGAGERVGLGGGGEVERSQVPRWPKWDGPTVGIARYSARFLMFILASAFSLFFCWGWFCEWRGQIVPLWMEVSMVRAAAEVCWAIG